MAQPADLPIAPATTAEYPPGVKTIKAGSGSVYAGKRGLTLYGMDMRTLLRWGPDPSKYCKDACAESWEPLLAPAGSAPNIEFPRGFGDRGAAPSGAPRPPGPPPLPAGFVQPQKAPDWTIIDGAAGPQWVYKGWHLVFTRKGDKRGSTAFDGTDRMVWNTLKFVPPVPEIVAPAGVRPVFADGAYALADKDGRVLFTGRCKSECDGWTPLAGGMASAGTGTWTVNRSGEMPQWTYRGSPVFVSQGENAAQIPSEGKVLRP